MATAMTCDEFSRPAAISRLRIFLLALFCAPYDGESFPCTLAPAILKWSPWRHLGSLFAPLRWGNSLALNIHLDHLASERTPQVCYLQRMEKKGSPDRSRSYPEGEDFRLLHLTSHQFAQLTLLSRTPDEPLPTSSQGYPSHQKQILTQSVAASPFWHQTLTLEIPHRILPAFSSCWLC
jgi:hypothetical protein